MLVYSEDLDILYMVQYCIENQKMNTFNFVAIYSSGSWSGGRLSNSSESDESNNSASEEDFRPARSTR